MTAPTKALAAYVRVSTAEQNEASQRAEIERWLAGNGIAPESVRWFIDKGASGDNLKRPAFEKLQKAVFMGEVGTVVVFMGEVGTVVVFKLDRLSRSLRDGINTLCDWCDRGLRVVATSQQIDFNGTVGKVLASVLLGLAEMEQQTRKERQAVGIALAKMRGAYKGRPAGTGWKASPERVQELRAKGLSIEDIGRLLGLGRNTVYVYLRRAAADAVQIAQDAP
jgi:DNA invertase Pin-like site-specific DNA recombinase